MSRRYYVQYVTEWSAWTVVDSWTHDQIGEDYDSYQLASDVSDEMNDNEEWNK